ncbi:sporulation protein YqfD [Bacillus sp. CGMCC 1.16541]|uniref:sporulation protein YqfD n=1 Tax=Bacillus sp. CGMCC 1.16541 TaxID=2185143 RepID=UPI000D72BA4B|nr:sporulation protein YqfD [Bacillus sp. CGMCC 1.16541]
MKNEWTNFVTGTVGISIKGKGIERFLNQCIRQNIHLLNIKRVNHESVSAEMLLKDLSKVRVLIRDADCKLYFRRRQGLPFVMKRMIKNGGFVLGLVAFLTILTLLSNMVWRVEITGAQPHTEHAIMKELEGMGVKQGRLQFLLDSPEMIQYKLTNNMSNITWVGVEVKGTSYHFQVVEKNEPKAQDQLSPQHIVAGKKATITNMFIEKGQPLVKVNEVVERGQPLVSGLIGKEGNQKVIAAKGKVFGETWYKSEVVIPLKTKFQVVTGNSYVKHYFHIGHLGLPIWGFKNEEYKTKKIESVKKPIYFLKWKLPIAYETITVREQEEIERNYSVVEAVQQGIKDGREQVMLKLDEDGKIKGEKVLHQREDNGKVKLSILYQVIENIAITQPIIQGD